MQDKLVVVSFGEIVIVSCSNRKRLGHALSLWTYHNEDFENGKIDHEDYKLLPDWLVGNGFEVISPEVINLP